MLNIKKTLTKLLTAEIVTISQASDFITLSSGFSAPYANINLKKCGKIIQGSFYLSRNVAWSAGSVVNIGTLKPGFRPSTTALVASDAFLGAVGTDGNIFLKPITAITANTNQNVVIFHITA